jgi:hemolysin activation/secretion protein
VTAQEKKPAGSIRPARLGVATLIALALAHGGAVAQTAGGGDRFPITGYDIPDATEFVSEAELAATLSPFIGPGKDFETIQNAVDALEKLLARRGVSTARVLLPEQEVDNGRIRLNIVVAVLGRLDVEGQQHHDEANIRAAVPGLVIGVPPDMKDVSAALRVANENPSKQTRLVFRQSKRDGEIDAVLRVADESPIKFGASLDNTGSPATGKYRLALFGQHANLWNRDHALSAQFVTSPGQVSDVRILGLGYRIPLYAWGDSIDFALAYSSVDSGSVKSVAGDFNIGGSGRIASARYNHNLPKLWEIEHKLILGLDQRAYGNEVTPAGGGASLIPDITVRPASIAWVPALRLDQIDLSGSLTYIRNLPGASNGERADFAQVGLRQGAQPDFHMLRYSANANYRFADDWHLRGAVSGQYTRDLLVAGEQFGIGGADSVRGFGERIVAKDIGIRGSIEVVTPDLARKLDWPGYGLRVVAFYDDGAVWLNKRQPGEARFEELKSAGLGLRAVLGRALSARLDLAQVIDGGAFARNGSHRMHGQLVAVF